jgi:hypothetical protein
MQRLGCSKWTETNIFSYYDILVNPYAVNSLLCLVTPKISMCVCFNIYHSRWPKQVFQVMQGVWYLIGRKPRSYMGRVFNSKLWCIARYCMESEHHAASCCVLSYKVCTWVMPHAPLQPILLCQCKKIFLAGKKNYSIGPGCNWVSGEFEEMLWQRRHLKFASNVTLVVRLIFKRYYNPPSGIASNDNQPKQEIHFAEGSCIQGWSTILTYITRILVRDVIVP